MRKLFVSFDSTPAAGEVVVYVIEPGTACYYVQMAQLYGSPWCRAMVLVEQFDGGIYVGTVMASLGWIVASCRSIEGDCLAAVEQWQAKHTPAAEGDDAASRDT